MLEYTVKVSKDGDREWCLRGELHREDGPAIERANGVRSWWLHGERHREDGPAIEFANGDLEWYLHGEPLTEDEHRARTATAHEMTVAEIEAALGHRVKVVKS